jgi:hypothetical protein
MRRLVFVLLVLLSSSAHTGAGEKSDLRVLYVGTPSSPRGQAYSKFLATHFRHAEVAERAKFDPARAKAFDVVLLDWSQDDRDSKLPLGPKDAWAKPTVLLGSAGLLLAEPWEIHGAIG